MKKSNKFMLIYVIVLLIVFPTVMLVKNLILEHQIETAVGNYVLDYCGVELKNIDVKVEWMSRSIENTRQWIAITNPEVGFLGGKIHKDSVTFSDKKCSNFSSYTLDKEKLRFVKSTETLEITRSIFSKGFIYFIWMLLFGVLVMCIILYMEKTKPEDK